MPLSSTSFLSCVQHPVALCLRRRPLLLQRRSHRHNKLVFLDVAVTGIPGTPRHSHSSTVAIPPPQNTASVHLPSPHLRSKTHRLVIELFSRDFPVAAQNFEDFCTGRMMMGGDQAAGEKANASKSASRGDELVGSDSDVHAVDGALFPSASPLLRPSLCYRHSTFHRFHKGYLMQGGDLHSDAGVGQVSTYGDETFDAPEERQKSLFTSLSAYTHNGKYSPKGLLGTAVAAPHLNGSQFFILTTHRQQDVEHLNHSCICFGQVQESSFPQLDELEREVPVEAGGEVRQGVRVEIVDCGLA